ncbi:MAG: ABC transporter substrate-binding protein, partial [Deltaproteobacteria bacterium]|nr:ABC transporter substrate-binding protein [Deltaproteobacteria bacterium]
TSFRTTADMIDSIRKIGNLTGEPKKAEALASNMISKLTSIKKRWISAEKKKILIVWGRNPIVVAGTNSYMNEHMDTIGATNAMASSKIPYPKIGLEELISMDPDVIIDLSMGSEKNDESGKIWSGVHALRAVREKKVYSMNTGDVRRGPRLADGLEKLAKMIHSE